MKIGRRALLLTSALAAQTGGPFEAGKTWYKDGIGIQFLVNPESPGLVPILACTRDGAGESTDAIIEVFYRSKVSAGLTRETTVLLHAAVIVPVVPGANVMGDELSQHIRLGDIRMVRVKLLKLESTVEFKKEPLL